MARRALGRGRSRSREERGAAAVEFALLILPLALIVFGIISFGFMLSFRQQVSQAATEGARAGAVQIDATKQVSDAKQAVDDAMRAIQVNGTDVKCGDGRLTCEVTKGPCANDTSNDCITVKLTYLYKANPVIPNIPLLDAVIPEKMTYTAVARVS